MPPPRVRGVHVGAVPGRAHLGVEAVLPHQDNAGDCERRDILHPDCSLL